MTFIANKISKYKTKIFDTNIKSYIITLTAALLISSSTGYCQVINVERERKTDNKTFSGKLNLSLKLEESQSTLWNTSNDLLLNLNLHKNQFIFFANWDLIKSAKESVQNKGFEHIRYNYLINNFFALDMFEQYQFNDVRKIKYRALAGLGIRMTIINKDSVSWAIGISMMYENRAFTYSSPVDKLWRINSYSNFKWKITKVISFNNIFYAQPKINNMNNINLSGEGNLTFKVSKHINIFISTTVAFESSPPIGVSSLYTTTKNGISCTF